LDEILNENEDPGVVGDDNALSKHDFGNNFL
jgi:hypothetical protein